MDFKGLDDLAKLPSLSSPRWFRGPKTTNSHGLPLSLSLRELVRKLSHLGFYPSRFPEEGETINRGKHLKIALGAIAKDSKFSGSALLLWNPKPRAPASV